MFKFRTCAAGVSRSSLRALLAGFLALLLSLTASAQTAPSLSLEQALQLAQDRSRQLPAQDALASSARHMAVAAAQLPDPVLKAGINNLPVNGPDAYSLNRDPLTMRSIGVMQEFVRGDKRSARAQRFEREAQASEAARALSLSNLQRDTTMAWLDCFYQARLLELLQRQRVEALLQIDAAQAAYRGARGAQADVLAARSALAQMDDRLAQAERQLATARSQLARWVGDAARQPLAELPDTSRVRISDVDLQSQLEHHPQVAVLARQEAVAQADAEIARSNQQTDFSVELMYNQLGPAYANMVSLNVSIPLQWDQKNRQDRELSAKLAVVEQLRSDREEATRAHVAEVQAMLQEWQSNRQRLERFDTTLLPLARERVSAALAAYRGGAGTLTAVLEARRGDIDTQMERIRLELETARLWAQLNSMTLAHEDKTATAP
jgi:outer membrane protein TolC